MESLDFWPFDILIIKNEITVVKCVVTLQCVVCVCLSLACNLSLIWGCFFFTLFYPILELLIIFLVTLCVSRSQAIPYRSGSGLGFCVIGINWTRLVASGST